MVKYAARSSSPRLSNARSQAHSELFVLLLPDRQLWNLPKGEEMGKTVPRAWLFPLPVGCAKLWTCCAVETQML